MSCLQVSSIDGVAANIAHAHIRAAENDALSLCGYVKQRRINLTACGPAVLPLLQDAPLPPPSAAVKTRICSIPQHRTPTFDAAPGVCCDGRLALPRTSCPGATTGGGTSTPQQPSFAHARKAMRPRRAARSRRISCQPACSANARPQPSAAHTSGCLTEAVGPPIREFPQQASAQTKSPSPPLRPTGSILDATGRRISPRMMMMERVSTRNKPPGRRCCHRRPVQRHPLERPAPRTQLTAWARCAATHACFADDACRPPFLLPAACCSHAEPSSPAHHPLLQVDDRHAGIVRAAVAAAAGAARGGGARGGGDEAKRKKLPAAGSLAVRRMDSPPGT